LAERFEFDGPVLVEAIAVTFERRGTPLPSALPAGLSAAFTTDQMKHTQWTAFRRRQPVDQKLPDLPDVIAGINRFVELPMLAANARQPFAYKWHSSRGWIA
jgi:hypothetical protein